MLLLIVGSALFSGSEAAFFSLSKRQLRTLARGRWNARLAARLMTRPDRLLSSVLFWNLVINMTYFALAAVIASAAPTQTLAVGITVVSLLAIIFFSEMLPKSFALLAPMYVAAVAAAPLTVAIRLVSPLLPAVTLIGRLIARLIWPNLEDEPELDLEDIRRAVDLGTDDAALRARERMALRELVLLAEIRVGEIMRTRSRWPRIEDPSGNGLLLDPRDRGDFESSNYVLVHDRETDEVHGTIPVRMLRPNQMDTLGDAVEPVLHVPWSARASQVLDQLNQEDYSVAVVVDEFGHWMGALTIDDLLRRVLLPPDRQREDGTTSITVIEDGLWQVAGDTSLRDLAKHLDVEIDAEGVTTVAGYLQRQNERIPRVGDEAEFESFVLRVESEDAPGIRVHVRQSDEPEPES